MEVVPKSFLEFELNRTFPRFGGNEKNSQLFSPEIKESSNCNGVKIIPAKLLIEKVSGQQVPVQNWTCELNRLKLQVHLGCESYTIFRTRPVACIGCHLGCESYTTSRTRPVACIGCQLGCESYTTFRHGLSPVLAVTWDERATRPPGHGLSPVLAVAAASQSEFGAQSHRTRLDTNYDRRDFVYLLFYNFNCKAVNKT